MKRKYADGGGIFREGMDVPANIEDMKSAPGPMTRAQRLGKMIIGKASDLTAAERKKFSRMPMEPVEGEEVGVKKKREESKVYKKRSDGDSVDADFQEVADMTKDMPPMRLPKSPLVMYAKGGKASSASARADGIASRGKTRGTIVMCKGGYKK